MHRMTGLLESRPALAGIVLFLVALIAAACKGGGSSGY
jgi:hypothetical protein